ncbi:hypothetical protein SAY86_000626 [Trapa natans]|uniref:Uncharacterized protein n=1 Tax=Trapa natans TaxID=22666 RepID=A0AAN7M4A7_TRANT|nr:hypothetical protein SAY86_000626 [Trapa natans]
MNPTISSVPHRLFPGEVAADFDPPHAPGLAALLVAPHAFISLEPSHLLPQDFYSEVISSSGVADPPLQFLLSIFSIWLYRGSYFGLAWVDLAYRL